MSPGGGMRASVGEWGGRGLRGGRRGGGGPQGGAGEEGKEGREGTRRQPRRAGYPRDIEEQMTKGNGEQSEGKEGKGVGEEKVQVGSGRWQVTVAAEIVVVVVLRVG